VAVAAWAAASRLLQWQLVEVVGWWEICRGDGGGRSQHQHGEVPSLHVQSRTTHARRNASTAALFFFS